ncbi:MAG: DNA repair protein RecN [Steroidobacteraceae bacterium]
MSGKPMLRHLQIRDFAIIDAIELEFGPGLTVLSGETGAGKSIMVDALELLCGARAGADVVRAGAERADVTATMDISTSGQALRQLLQEHSLEEDGELVLRRAVGNDGRSRCWINGQTVPVQVLRQISELLCDIHGQHEFQSLVRAATQRELLDDYGRLESAVAQVRAAHGVWLALLNRTVELESAASDQNSRLDLLRHQLQELQALQLQEGEVTTLGEERQRLSQADRLLDSTRTALEVLYEADGASAHAALARAQSALRLAAESDNRLAAQLPLIDEALVRVKEVGSSLAHYLDTLDLDPKRQDFVERRLAAIEELARKHRCRPEELSARGQSIGDELHTIEQAGSNLATLRPQLARALASYQEHANVLSTRRRETATALSGEVSGRMQELGMPGGHFEVLVEPLDANEPAAHGVDRIEFRVSPNAGMPARALAKVASGGELSRLSLAVQVSCARHAAPLMVFDEVDSGIGGAVAEIVGRELRSLGARAQVLCVTHLPQVAAQAHQHWRVAKLADQRGTRTQVTRLDETARVEELARMLGGVDITDRARAHAREMIEKAREPGAARASTERTARRRSGVRQPG